jgi:hypothetical protein
MLARFAEDHSQTIDWTLFDAARTRLGPQFVRRLVWFRSDGLNKVDLIELGMRLRAAPALINPAAWLREDAALFGAVTLHDVAEAIEITARDCLERKQPVDELLPAVTRLRSLFSSSVALMEEAANPLVRRKLHVGSTARLIVGTA